MGKASSAKKVARAARAGGKTTNTRRNIAFPAAIVAIVVLGVGLIAFARTTTPGGGPPTLDDHWHAAFGIYVCDRWVQNLSDRGPDTLGIHTHDDGLVHIHPFLAGATGEAANLGKFFDQTGMRVTDTSITLPPGDVYEERTYKQGETTCGGEEAEVVAARWANAAEATGEPDEVRRSDIGGMHFEEDLSAFTIAFLPKGADVPVPPWASDIVSLGAADGGSDAPVSGQPEDSERPDESSSGSELPTDLPLEDPASSEVTPDTAATDESGSTEVPADDPASTEAPAGDTATSAPAESTAPAGG